MHHFSTHKLKANTCSIRFYLQLSVGGSRLIYVIRVCLHIVVSNTYCVVFLFCFSSSCVPYVVSISGLSILVFSNVYLVIKNIIRSIIIIVIVLYQLLQVDKKKRRKQIICSFLHFTKVQNADEKLKIIISCSECTFGKSSIEDFVI